MTLKRILNWLAPKWLRRKYCKHVRSITTSPNVNDVIDMGQVVTIYCTNCHMATTRTAYHILLVGWNGEFSDADV